MADVRLPQGDISTWDEDNAGDEIPQRVGPMDELGVTGVKRVSGYIDEEFLPALRGRKAVRVYREMSSNDSMVAAAAVQHRQAAARGGVEGAPARAVRPGHPGPGVPRELHGGHVPHLGRLHRRDAVHDHLRVELARDRLQAPAGSVAEGRQEAVQAHRRADRLAEDADPGPGDPDALVLRRDRWDQVDGADGTAAVRDHGDPDREERPVPDLHRQGQPGGPVPAA